MLGWKKAENPAYVQFLKCWLFMVSTANDGQHLKIHESLMYS